MLVFAFMIVFGFPPLILATLLLELERVFDWPFFLVERGGDPLLWQHLFWLFGHPEVYIIFLPAAGMVSMILPTMAGVPLVAYRWVVLAIVGTGFLSFALWVHHMFTTGIPYLSLSFFSAASMAVTIPSGIQVFAWIATLWNGRPRLCVPMLFILGFLFIFTMGGLTGVMVAAVPFDWQVHDTYFVVAHFHYVLIGGMVFPLFAAFYYWAPTVNGRLMSERLGRWAFGLIFVGFNVTFFPMHFTGLLGMPRRVYTFPEGLGWEWLNLISSLGAFMIAAGVAVFLFDLLNLRFGRRAGPNPWNASTLEWLPQGSYAARSVPQVRSRDPLWDHPALGAEVDAGHHYLPGSATGRRETIITSPLDARPQYVQVLPGPSWFPLLAAAGTAAFFLLLTVKLVIPALAGGVLAVAMIFAWVWSLDRAPTLGVAEIGGGLRLPTWMTGPTSHSWWATITLVMVAGSVFASLVFSYFFLWTVNVDGWLPPDGIGSGVAWPLASFLATLAGAALIHLADRALGRERNHRRAAVRLALAAAIVVSITGVALELWGLWRTGLRPQADSYGALVFTFVALQGFFAAVLALMAFYALARSFAGLLDGVNRATFDCMKLLWYYATAQWSVALAVVHLFPPALAMP